MIAATTRALFLYFSHAMRMNWHSAVPQDFCLANRIFFLFHSSLEQRFFWQQITWRQAWFYNIKPEFSLWVDTIGFGSRSHQDHLNWFKSCTLILLKVFSPQPLGNKEYYIGAHWKLKIDFRADKRPVNINGDLNNRIITLKVNPLQLKLWRNKSFLHQKYPRYAIILSLYNK